MAVGGCCVGGNNEKLIENDRKSEADLLKHKLKKVRIFDLKIIEVVTVNVETKVKKNLFNEQTLDAGYQLHVIVHMQDMLFYM